MSPIYSYINFALAVNSYTSLKSGNFTLDFRRYAILLTADFIARKSPGAATGYAANP